MPDSNARELMRRLLTEPGSLDLLFAAAPDAELADLAARSARTLAADQFTGATDERISPFVQVVHRQEAAARSIGVPELEAGLRRILTGAAGRSPADTVLQVLLCRGMVFQNGVPPQRVDRMLAGGDGGGRRRPLIWSAAGAGLAVAALLITGLAAPGWMRGGGGGEAAPAAVVDRLVHAQRDHNLEGVQKTLCHRVSDQDLQGGHVDTSNAPKIVVHGSPKVSGDEAQQDLTLIEPDGRKDTATVRLRKTPQRWCVDRIDIHSAP